MHSSHWFFTWRTYGSWLPGEEGFVGYHRRAGHRVIDHEYGRPATDALPDLKRFACRQMTAPAVELNARQAAVLLTQFHETATVRGRSLDAVAILKTHIHIVFGTPGEPEPGRMLADWKAYASRSLNATNAPADATERFRWWAEEGSKRRLFTEDARASAVAYVRDQRYPLAVWLSDQWKGQAG